MDTASEAETARPSLAPSRFAGASPIVPVRRVAKTAAFYTELLGFCLRDRNAECTYAYLSREGAGVILLDLGDAKALRAVGEYFSVYFWVEDVVAYYREIEPKLQRLGERRLQPLFQKPDGRHEFHVRDPDGCLLFFGAPLAETAGAHARVG